MLNLIKHELATITTEKLLHYVGVSVFIGLIWLMFVGYFVSTPPVWWHA